MTYLYTNDLKPRSRSECQNKWQSAQIADIKARDASRLKSVASDLMCTNREVREEIVQECKSVANGMFAWKNWAESRLKEDPEGSYAPLYALLCNFNITKISEDIQREMERAKLTSFSLLDDSNRSTLMWVAGQKITSAMAETYLMWLHGIGIAMSDIREYDISADIQAIGKVVTNAYIDAEAVAQAVEAVNVATSVDEAAEVFIFLVTVAAVFVPMETKRNRGGFDIKMHRANYESVQPLSACILRAISLQLRNKVNISVNGLSPS